MLDGQRSHMRDGRQVSSGSERLEQSEEDLDIRIQRHRRPHVIIMMSPTSDIKTTKGSQRLCRRSG
jgi:hypothetical protein